MLTLSHDIDTAIWLFGDIEETNGFLSDKRVLNTTTDECSIITTKHKNGIIGSLFFDYLQDPPKRSLEIVASKGNIHWDYYSGQMTIINKKKRSSITYLTPKDYERNKMFLEEVEHFIECIRNNSVPMITINDGLRVLKVVLTIKKSEKKEL